MDYKTIIPFGKVIGKDLFGITAYSCYTKNPNLIRYGRFYIFGNILTGIKWECVEFIRRWFIIRYSITFQEIENAYQIFNTNYLKFTNLITGENISYTKYYNGSIGNLLPIVGSIIIWNKFGQHPYGHCAVVLHIDENYIYIAEQNWDNKKWENNYSRKIQFNLGMLNSVSLIDQNKYNVPILGWLTLDNLEKNIFYPQLNTRFNSL